VEQLADRLFGDRRGSHASPAEISVTMAHLPGAVEPIAGPLDMASCRPRGIPGSERFRRFYPDGRIGADPSLASPQHGEALVAAAVEAIAAEAVDLLAELAAG
jgi:creatinine amidohydrolase